MDGEDGPRCKYCPLSAVSTHLALCVWGRIRLIVFLWQEAPTLQQSKPLSRRSAKVVPLFLRVGLDRWDDVSVAPVLVIQNVSD